MTENYLSGAGMAVNQSRHRFTQFKLYFEGKCLTLLLFSWFKEKKKFKYWIVCHVDPVPVAEPSIR